MRDPKGTLHEAMATTVKFETITNLVLRQKRPCPVIFYGQYFVFCEGRL